MGEGEGSSFNPEEQKIENSELGGGGLSEPSELRTAWTPELIQESIARFWIKAFAREFRQLLADKLADAIREANADQAKISQELDKEAEERDFSDETAIGGPTERETYWRTTRTLELLTEKEGGWGAIDAFMGWMKQTSGNGKDGGQAKVKKITFKDAAALFASWQKGDPGITEAMVKNAYKQAIENALQEDNEEEERLFYEDPIIDERVRALFLPETIQSLDTTTPHNNS